MTMMMVSRWRDTSQWSTPTTGWGSWPASSTSSPLSFSPLSGIFAGSSHCLLSTVLFLLSSIFVYFCPSLSLSLPFKTSPSSFSPLSWNLQLVQITLIWRQQLSQIGTPNILLSGLQSWKLATLSSCCQGAATIQQSWWATRARTWPTWPTARPPSRAGTWPACWSWCPGSVQLLWGKVMGTPGKTHN